MLRIYRTLVEQILLFLLYMRDMGHDKESTTRYAQERWTYCDKRANRYHEPILIDQVRSVLGVMEDHEPLSISELISDLSGMLKVGSKDAEVHLIDAIVRALQLPYTQNAISGNMLKRLRQAVLLPEECAGLEQRLRLRELSCTSCGHLFINGEACVISVDPGAVTIRCTACKIPSYKKCSKCPGSSTLSSPAIDMLYKQDNKACTSCATAGDGPPGVNAVGNTLNTFYYTPRQQAGATVGPEPDFQPTPPTIRPAPTFVPDEGFTIPQPRRRR